MQQYVVVDPRDGNKVMGKYKSAAAARLARDRLDNRYGAVRYKVREAPKTTRFIVGGDESVAYGLRDMLNANRDDESLCAWLVQAKPGDKFSDGEGCECIAGLPASWMGEVC